MSNIPRARVNIFSKPPSQVSHVELVVKRGTQKDPRTALIVRKNVIAVNLLLSKSCSVCLKEHLMNT